MKTINSRAALRAHASAVRIGLSALAISIAVGLSTLPEPALAQDAQVVQFNIQSQPLSKALLQLGEQASLQIFFSQEIVDGYTASSLSGSFAPEDALRRLLAGTGIEFRRTGRNISLSRPASEESTQLAPVRVQGRLQATTEGSGSYGAQGATLMKGMASLKEIPQSVTVITRKQMDDQRLDTIDEVLENTPGIVLWKRPGGGGDIISRGFSTTSIQYDGVPLPRGSYWGNSFAGSSVYLDRVEVLRGAQGLLEGAGNPAGAVNVVRKRGLAYPALAVEARVGSWDNYGGRIETGGALDDDGRLRSRVVLDYEDRGYFVDTVGDHNLNAYAALDLDVAPDTTLGFGVAHSRLKGNRSLRGSLPFFSDGTALDVPRSHRIGARWSDADRKETQLFLDFEHRFNADWSIKVAGVYVNESWDAVTSGWAAALPAPGTRTVPGYGYIYDYDAVAKGVDANLSGRVRTWSVDNDIVLGISYSRQKRNDGYLQWANYISYDIFDPRHDAPGFEGLPPSSAAAARYDTREKGLYGMVRSHLTDRLTLILGARASWYRRLDDSVYGQSEAKESGKLTPYAGVVYDLTPQWSLYASYADVFEPQIARDAQLNTLDPIVGANYEVGIKGELLDGALGTSLAVFRIDQKNRAITDYDSPPLCDGNFCSRAAGEVRSEGIDLEIHGEVLPGWQLSGGYTWNRNEFLADSDPSRVGRPFEYAMPKHLLRLWSNWQLPGNLHRWQVGAGVHYQSERRNSAFRLQGGYSVWDVRLAYQFDKNWSAALNINNVFDKRYYSSIADFPDGYFGEPRNFLLTLRGSF
ncbi:TonB-dependent siderophore receptor [Pusillimonas caeni]|uniref:TonB-dependent siderophore receptor n=1 Tax=Pusillimonas caeni TaxID=1348472 RepID=UPI001ADDBA3C|nr:TonB-dependent receptor [Pusillimonas caeni]